MVERMGKKGQGQFPPSHLQPNGKFLPSLPKTDSPSAPPLGMDPIRPAPQRPCPELGLRPKRRNRPSPPELRLGPIDSGAGAKRGKSGRLPVNCAIQGEREKEGGKKEGKEERKE